jgi:nucleoside-triphosphatase THEP1
MRVIDLMTGNAIGISQELGNGAEGCKLDPAGLAEAAVAVSTAVAANVDLVVVNKFGKQEAAGGGLRAGIADAVMAGVPLLTAVPERSLDAWLEFTGSLGTTLLCERNYIEAWWRNVSLHEKLARARASVQLHRSGLAMRRVSRAADVRTLPAV